MNKDVLLTGGSGFLGSIIARSGQGNIITLGRREGNHIKVDLANEIPILPVTQIVIHNAAKVHFIPKSKSEINSFFDTNVKGTRNLLNGIEKLKTLPDAIIFISSVSVYGLESGDNISENSRLLGGTPYADSKIEAEKILVDWGLRNNVKIGILRLPLVAGPNPPGNLGSMINGIKKGYYFNIRGIEVRKSIVLAEDVVKILPQVATKGGIYNLTDGYHPSLNELSNLIAMQLGKKPPRSINKELVCKLAYFGDFIGSYAPLNTDKLSKMLHSLTFDDSKARHILDWTPEPVMLRYNIFK